MFHAPAHKQGCTPPAHPPVLLPLAHAPAQAVRPVYLTALRVGDTFTFSPDGAVYVKCRGGYRPGRGGALVKASADQRVYRWNA